MKQSKRTTTQSKPIQVCYACGKWISGIPIMAVATKRVFCTQECFRVNYLKMKS